MARTLVPLASLILDLRGVIMMVALHALTQAADENKVGARPSPRCQSAAERTSSGGRTFWNLISSRMS